MKLLALFIGVPLIDLVLLLFAGSWLGPWPTFGIVVLTGILGSTLARREGLGVLVQLQQDTARGLPPRERLVEAVLIFVGGILLLTPGFLTDLAGFAMIIPATRKLLAPFLMKEFAKRVRIQTVSMQGAPGADPFGGPFEPPPRRGPSAPHPQHDPFDHPVR